MALQEQEANRPWYEKTAIGAWEFFKEFVIQPLKILQAQNYQWAMN